MFGSTQVHELLDGGADMLVNQENKDMYAMLLIDFWFNQQCEEHFSEFKKGFYKVVTKEIIEICRPEELEHLVCGSAELDFEDLEKGAQYDNGYV